MKDSKFTIWNSSFNRNIGKEGGAIHATTTYGLFFPTSIKDTIFDSNSAVQGGAIKYTLFEPDLFNITFISNTAHYGPNIASYPIKIMFDGNLRKKTLNEVDSGNAFKENITVSLVD